MVNHFLYFVKIKSVKSGSDEGKGFFRRFLLFLSFFFPNGSSCHLFSSFSSLSHLRIIAPILKRLLASFRCNILFLALKLKAFTKQYFKFVFTRHDIQISSNFDNHNIDLTKKMDPLCLQASILSYIFGNFLFAFLSILFSTVTFSTSLKDVSKMINRVSGYAIMKD